MPSKPMGLRLRIMMLVIGACVGPLTGFCIVGSWLWMNGEFPRLKNGDFQDGMGWFFLGISGLVGLLPGAIGGWLISGNRAFRDLISSKLLSHSNRRADTPSPPASSDRE
jgi:hypothetical protein